MSISLKTNLFALGAQRQLNTHTRELQSVSESLSSGLRINRASDDAAGLAIADSLRVDATLHQQANRNINDGISMLNIMDGALNEQKNILIRLSELAEQSANGVNSNEQRSAIDQEYQALVKEYGRIADTTEFNGQKLLRGTRDGAAEELVLQVGTDSDSSSTISIAAVDTALFSGVLGARGDYTGEGNVDASDTSIFSPAIGAAETIDELGSMTGNSLYRTEITDANGDLREVYVAPGIYDFGGNGELIYIVLYQTSDGGFDSIGNTVSTDPDFVGDIFVTFTDNGALGTVSLDFTGLTAENMGPGTLADGAFDPTTARKSEIAFTGVESQGRALDALFTVKNRLEDLSSIQGGIGALQSRLGTAAAVALGQREAIRSAESQIRDADVATQAAELVRRRILQQSAAAVLSQANQQPSLALTLLQS